MNRLFAVILSLALVAPLLRAQPASASKVSVVGEVMPPRILPGASGKLVLTISIAPGWHLNSYGMTAEDVLPTEFGWTPPPGFVVTGTQYPRGEPVSVSFQKEPLYAYQDEVQIVVDFRLGEAVRPGTVLLAGDLTVQACSENVCLMPSDLEVSVPLEVLRPIRLKKNASR
jgi:thiol:disulfide interchange protein DsbD